MQEWGYSTSSVGQDTLLCWPPSGSCQLFPGLLRSFQIAAQSSGLPATSLLCLISKFAESALCPILQIIDENTEQFRTPNLFAVFIATYALVKDFTGFSIQWALAFLAVSACLGQCLSIPARLPVPAFTFCIVPFSPGLWSCFFPASPLRILSSTISQSLQARQPPPFTHTASTFTLLVNQQQSTVFANNACINLTKL